MSVHILESLVGVCFTVGGHNTML